MRIFEAILLIAIVIWECLLAGSTTYRGGKLLAELSFGAHGLRIGVPLALLAANLLQNRGSMEFILRVGTCLTFAVHGLQALYQSPVFTTMILGTGYNFGIELQQETVESLLLIIGVVDIIVALLILGVRWQWLAIYMGFWGFITALARTTGGSFSSYPETLMRMVHAGGPCWLFLEWRRQSKENKETQTIQLAQDRP